jgi:hypothetical protein
MGLYRIPIRLEKVRSIPQLMKSIGFPVVRTEKQEIGTCYFCANPKRSRTNWTFWISREEEGGPRYFQCRLSQLSKQIVNALTMEGFFNREGIAPFSHPVRRGRDLRRRTILSKT